MSKFLTHVKDDIVAHTPTVELKAVYHCIHTALDTDYRLIGFMCISVGRQVERGRSSHCDVQFTINFIDRFLWYPTTYRNRFNTLSDLLMTLNDEFCCDTEGFYRALLLVIKEQIELKEQHDT